MDKKTSEPVNFKKVFIIIVVIWTIISILICLPSTINYYKKHNTNNNEEIKEQDRIQEEKKQERIQESIHNGIDIKLKKLGFEEYNDSTCPNNDKCLTNGQYKIDYDITGWFNIKRKIDENEKFDSKDDLLLIGNLYNNEKISTRSSIINNIFGNSKENHISSFINMDGLHFYISRSSTTIHYSIMYYKVDNDLELDIDSLSSTSFNEKYDRLKMYNLLFNDYKNRFPVYDFINHYKQYLDNYNISVDMHYNNYRVKEAYSSYYSFDFDKRGYNDNLITVIVPGSLYEGQNVGLINNDLKYFSNKFDGKYELTKEDKESIKMVMSQDYYKTTINKNNLTITIERIAAGRAFYITYNFD